MPPKNMSRKPKQRRRPVRKSNNQLTTQQYRAELNVSSFPKPTRCIVGKESGPFPDEYICTLKTDVNSTHAGAAQVANTYSINGPSYLFGPQADWAGAFSANYPAGVKYLLGSAVITGSSAPYRFSTVLNYRYEFEFINNSSVPIDIILFPSINPSYIGMTKSNLSEQRGAIKLALPSTQIAGPYRCRLQGSVSNLFGVSEAELHGDTDYVQIVGAAPTRQCFMHVVAGAKDGTTSINMSSTLTAYSKIKFSGLNPFATGTPT